jgi:hypothetical protein
MMKSFSTSCDSERDEEERERRERRKKEKMAQRMKAAGMDWWDDV